jgi:undecaprenyl-diphosphatase
MHLLEALLLGLVQGLTEFLPVSSSAHVRIVGLLLPDAEDPGAAFTAVTQLGTETAVLIYFWRDIARIAVAWWWVVILRRSGTSSLHVHDDTRADVRLGWLVILGTVPIGVAGVLLQDAIATIFRSLWLVATVLIVFGLILGVVDRLSRHTKGIEQMSIGGGLLVGLAQTLALVPGVSRSGATVSMGLVLGYTRSAASRFAFLMAVPAVFLSGLYELASTFAGSPGHQVFTLGETIGGTLVAFVVGYVVIRAFMNYISKRSFMPFVAYRVALGTVLLILLGTGAVDA